MTISTEEHMQDVIRGDMLQLDKLLEICNVPEAKVKQIKKVVTRAITRGSDYGYNLGRDDKLRDGERSEYLELMQKYDALQYRYDGVYRTNRNYYAQIQRLKAKIERMQRMNNNGKRL